MVNILRKLQHEMNGKLFVSSHTHLKSSTNQVQITLLTTYLSRHPTHDSTHKHRENDGTIHFCY